MTIKFEHFAAALEQLCREHGVALIPSEDEESYLLEVWDYDVAVADMINQLDASNVMNLVDKTKTSTGAATST